jgi:DNA-directed RNA polymerase specialized sigma24 family protein
VLEAPLMIDTTKKDAADLYWLAFLLAGRPDVSIDIAVETAVAQQEASPFFASWMRSWSRRIVVAKALAAIRDELAESARRTELARIREWAAPARGWSLPPQTTKAQIEEALLAIDVFPRAALLLLIFERLRIADAATLLDADAALVRKAQALALRDLTANLARRTSQTAPGFSPALALA